MLQTNISTIKSQLSSYLDRVKSGEEVIIAERSRPIAKIVRYSSSGSQTDGWAARLAESARRGEVRLSAGSGEPLRLQPARAPKNGAKVVAALLEERRKGR